MYSMVQKIDLVIYCLILDFHCMSTLLVFYLSDLSLLNLYYVDTLYFIGSNQVEIFIKSLKLPSLLVKSSIPITFILF